MTQFMTRDESIIELGAWLRTPPGRYLLAWEQDRLDHARGRCLRLPRAAAGPARTRRPARQPHAAPLGGQRLAASCPSRCRAAAAADDISHHAARRASRCTCTASSTRCRSRARSLDLVVLPHALELARDPHLTLREVERVLVPEGRVVIAGFNPASLWGLRQRAGRLRGALGLRRGRRPVPAARRRVHRLLAAARLAAPAGLRGRGRALRLLAPAAAAASAGCSASPGWTAWATAGGRCSARSTSCSAVKRVRGMRLVGLAQARRRKAATPRRPAVVAPARSRRSRRYGDMMTEIEIYTDGACKGNPGPGGWGAWLQSRRARERSCGAASR